jgi:tetratricopeptide (TPR) repeat protein
MRDPPLTLVEAGLATLALLILAREMQLLVLRRRPRPVEVNGFEAGDGSDAWSALVKATLHKLGALPQPSVPQGSIQPTALSLVDVELPAQASAVAGALHFVAERFKVRLPYRVTATSLPSETGDHCALLEIVDAVKGTLEAQHRIAEPSIERSARLAGCLVYQDIAARRGTPPWERWEEPEGASLMQFLAGTEAETALDHVEALHRYGEAARAEPSNAIIQLRLGNLQERQKLYAMAMRTYAEALITWPHLIQPRHRIAITMVAIAMDDRVAVPPAVERSLALLRSDSGGKLSPSGDVRIDLLKAAQVQWSRIAAAFRLDRTLYARLRREGAIVSRTRQGIKRGPMRRNAKVAQLGIELYIMLRAGAPHAPADRRVAALERKVRATTATGPVRRLAHRVLRTSPDYRAHYNSACFYSVLLAVDGENPTYVDRAVEQLRRVLRTADREHVFGWALDDQDLAPLWQLVEQTPPPDGIDAARLSAIDLLRHQLAGGPTIRSVDPTASRSGGRVKIRGINLDGGEIAVTFGTTPARLVAVRAEGYDTELEVEVPTGVPAGEVGLAVQVDGRASGTRPFQVEAPARIEAESVARLHEHLRDEGFVLSGAPIPIALERLVLGRRQVAEIRRAGEVVLRVIARFCDAYPHDIRLREQLALPPWEDELVRVPHVYPNPVQIGRFDGVVSSDGVRFVELNAETPASMGYADVANAALGFVLPVDGCVYTPMLPSVAAALLSVHRSAQRADARLPPTPSVAIVDQTTTSWHDVEKAVDGLRAHGIEAVRITPDQIRYDGSQLEAAGRRVDLVYRRFLLEELQEGDLTAAVRDRRVVLVNAFRSRVANNKKLLALLDDAAFEHLMRPAEAAIVRAVIPWTRIVRRGPVRKDGRTVDLEELCMTERERLVIKPAVGYGGEGVHIGVETPQAAWEALLREALGGETHVVQEFVLSPERVVPILEDGEVSSRRGRVSISPFIIGGRYAGTMARIADRHMVNLAAGGAFYSCVEAPP